MAVQSRTRLLIAFLIAALIGVAVIVVLHLRTPQRGPLTLLPKRVQPTELGWTVHHSVVAGDGSIGFGDGMHVAARFADPYSVVMDRAGNLYVSDAGDNNRIRKIIPGGSVTVLAGGAEGYADGAGAAAAFHTPSGLALDRAGNVYVADTGNNAIRKITPQGVVTTIAGGSGAGWRDGVGSAALFNGPLGVAVDANGVVYVADTYNDRIRRIGADGTVSTLAGAEPGNADGPGMLARFDTPSAIALDSQGVLFIADTANGNVRKLGRDGVVSTLAGTGIGGSGAVSLRRPVALALTFDGYLYVADMDRGRVFQLAPDGAVHGLTGVGLDFAVGDAHAVRLGRPTGLALDRDGSLYVADSVARVVRKLGREPVAASVLPAAPAPAAVTPVPAQASFPWPVAPQQGPHEVVGIVGECRGSYDGESRHHFHNGLDVQADMGTPVLAVANEKVSSPVANWAFGGVAEGMTVDRMAYIHMRVGRDGRDRLLDGARFDYLRDAKGKPNRVRLKRGTRFAVGDTLGTVNRMFHVHLVQRDPAGVFNPIALPFPGLRDTIAPRIDGIFLIGQDGQRLPQQRGQRVLVRRDGGPLSLVAEAWDQIDGNAARRKLGLYRAGFQILHADGSPLPGFEHPRVNIEFNRLPADDETVKLAYAQGSGITVYGSARTRFLYVLTNVVRDGHAKQGSWDPATLAAGDYTIRVLAADYAGNVAAEGRDLPISVQEMPSLLGAP